MTAQAARAAINAEAAEILATVTAGGPWATLARSAEQNVRIARSNRSAWKALQDLKFAVYNARQA